MKSIILAGIAAVVAFYLLFEAARFAYLVHVSRGVIAQAHPYTNATGTISMLVLGDSTAYGVGTTEAGDTVPGRLGRALNAKVENYAKSGAVVADLSAQLAKAQQDHYDLILIQAGGNDVIRFHSLSATELEMDAVLKAARTKADKVVFLTSGRVGRAPLFPWFMREILTARSGDLRTRFMQLAKKDDAIFVDLFDASVQFNADPQRFYAPDGLHPSADGYAVWYETVRSVMQATWPGFLHA